MKTITELEQIIINAYNQMQADGNELVFIGDIPGDPKQIRGALASLVKKGFADVNKEDGGLISIFNSCIWEGFIIDELEKLMNVNRSDAQGFFDAQSFYISQAWGMDLSPENAAQYIIDKVIQSK